MICEGYEYPEDRYVLKNSCQLLFSIVKDSSSHSSSYHNQYNSYGGYGGGGRGGSTSWGTIILFGLIGYVVYKIAQGNNRQRRFLEEERFD